MVGVLERAKPVPIHLLVVCAPAVHYRNKTTLSLARELIHFLPNTGAKTYALLSFAGYFQGEDDPANGTTSSRSPDLSSSRLCGEQIRRIQLKLNTMPDVSGDRSEEEYNAELKGNGIMAGRRLLSVSLTAPNPPKFDYVNTSNLLDM